MTSTTTLVVQRIDPQVTHAKLETEAGPLGNMSGSIVNWFTGHPFNLVTQPNTQLVSANQRRGADFLVVHLQGD